MLKMLYVDESEVHGDVILGPVAYRDALELGVAQNDAVDVRFAPLPRAGAIPRSLTRSLPPLDRLDLDLQPLRWFAVHGVRTRRHLRAHLQQFPADVVHVCTHAITLGLTAVAPGLPLILAADAPVWEWRSMSRAVPVRPHSRLVFAACDALERHALRRADIVFAYTAWARDRLLAAAPDAEVRVRTPGVDLMRFRPAARRPRERPRLLFIGSRFAEKGGHDLLSALGGMLGAELDLDVVTREPLAPRPGVEIHRLGRSDPELLDLLQQADLLCLPTYADTMSFAAIEALACGTPVVASAVGGVPEVVAEAGAVVPPGDVHALRRAIEGLVADPGRLAALGARGREIAERRFDARIQTAVLLDAAGELVARRREPRPRAEETT